VVDGPVCRLRISGLPTDADLLFFFCRGFFEGGFLAFEPLFLFAFDPPCPAGAVTAPVHFFIWVETDQVGLFASPAVDVLRWRGPTSSLRSFSRNHFLCSGKLLPPSPHLNCSIPLQLLPSLFRDGHSAKTGSQENGDFDNLSSRSADPAQWSSRALSNARFDELSRFRSQRAEYRSLSFHLRETEAARVQGRAFLATALLTKDLWKTRRPPIGVRHWSSA